MKMTGAWMTIKRGQDWGLPAEAGGADQFAANDKELRAIVETNYRNQAPIPVLASPAVTFGGHSVHPQEDTVVYRAKKLARYRLT